MYSISSKRLLLAESGRQGDGLGAAVDLLHGRGAVARGVVGGAVELLAARAGREGVALAGEGVAELGAQLV